MSERELLCASPECVSLRRELATLFGVPVVRNGSTWNEAILRLIADERHEADVRVRELERLLES